MANMNEQERREAALAAMGGEVLGAREVPAKDILQMLSVRMEPDLIGDLRAVAESRGLKVSELLREAATRLVTEYRQQQVHMTTWSHVQSFRIDPMIAISPFGGQACSATYVSQSV